MYVIKRIFIRLDTAVRKSKIPTLVLFILLIVISITFLKSKDDLIFVYLQSKKISTNVVCGKYRDIETKKLLNPKFKNNLTKDFSISTKTYTAEISSKDGLLTIRNSTGTHNWFQADLSSVYIDGCTQHPDIGLDISIEKEGETIVVTTAHTDKIVNKIIFYFKEDYILYYPETTFSQKQGWAGQSFLTGILGGVTLGMLNPDPHGNVRDGVFNDFRLPTETELLMRNAVGIARKENDYLNFAPTTDAWYMTGNNQIFIHGLAGLNPADGISLKVPNNKNYLSVHYANISNTLGIEPNIIKKGVAAIITIADSDSIFDGFQSYYNALVKENAVPKNNYPVYDWWTKGIYCTWFETHDLTSPEPDLVYKAIEAFEVNNIKVGTIILDEGWAGNGIYGDWEYDKIKYPYDRGLRTFIDDLHDKGYKVLLHFMPFSVSRSSKLRQEHPEYINKYLDYTHPQAREHMKERLRIMLSDDPDAYNADGLKVDFIHRFSNSADFIKQYHDPTKGRGLDYLHYALKWLYDTAKEIKPDAFISQFGVHPLFQDTTDGIRTGDYSGEVIPNGINRIKIKHILMPQSLSIYDMHLNGRWDFKTAALGYATSIPHVVFKVAPGFSGEYENLPAISQAYDKVRNVLKKQNLDSTTIKKLHGVNEHGDIIWELKNEIELIIQTDEGEEIIYN